MHELFAKIAAETGIDEAAAKKAVGHILAFVKAEGDDPAVGKMIAETPGAEDAMATAGEGGSGGLMGGMLGGGIMGLGLGMGEIQTVARELVAFAKTQTDPETVDKALSSVPGLSQYI